jgi:hypothetical protein
MKDGNDEEILTCSDELKKFKSLRCFDEAGVVDVATIRTELHKKSFRT